MYTVEVKDFFLNTTKLQMALIIKSRNRENGEGTNGTSHFGQTAQVRLTKLQMAQVVAQMA